MNNVPFDRAYIKSFPKHYTDLVPFELLVYMRTELNDGCPCWLLVQDEANGKTAVPPPTRDWNGGNRRHFVRSRRPSGI